MSEQLAENKSRVTCLVSALLTLYFAFIALPASAATYQLGDVFVAVSNGKVQHYDATGRLVETLDTLRGGYTTGMAFDTLGNLYVTNFGAGTVSRFDNSGGLLGTFGSGYSGHPESIVFDRNGNAYVGAVDGDNRIRKFDPLGNPLAQFSVATESRGSDWLDLSADQCTIFYTSEGPDVKRFDVCRNIQLPNFNVSALPSSPAYALRILPDGGALVADTSEIVRLDSAGNVIQTYNSAGEGCWFALNLDPDGKSFWSADFCSANVYKFDIQTGAELLKFNTGTGPNTVFGLVVFGELSASRPIGVASTFGTSGRSGSFSDPVNTSTGNYYFSRTDLVIPGRGLAFNFTRSYNSLDSYPGPLGAGWTHSYNIFLRKNSSGTITLKEGDGHEVLFVPAGGGNYTSETPGVFDNLAQNTDKSFTLTRKNQTRLAFSQGGKLLTITDRNGNVQTLLYDGAENLSEITDTVGRSVILTYDSDNRIVRVTDPIGHSAIFNYDENDNLVKTTDPAGSTTVFTYDSNHRVASITLPNGHLLLQNTYDAIGRVISQTNGRGFKSVFAYGIPNPTDTTITDARGDQTVHTSDASLRIIRVTDALGGTVNYTYDGSNDRTAVSNQNGWANFFTYDEHGNLTSLKDSLGNMSTFTYDSKNNLLTAKNPKGKTTAFSYDANGNLHTITDALNHTTTFAYNGSGGLTSKTDANSHTTAYAYDSAGNLVQITDALGAVTNLGYDGIGRLISITDPNGHTAHAYYDILSRLIRIADALGEQTRFEYDAVGNLAKIIDANGHATTYAYDATNNLISVADALGHVTEYAYDANNNRISFKNAKGNATSYAYDALNRLTAITDPLHDVTSYAYDPVGNVTGVTDANGKTNQFAYDQLNRLISISYADGKGVTYAYDADGNRTSMEDSHGTTVYAYDVLDRLTAVTNPDSRVVSYEYDAVGNHSSLTYPGGISVAYSYDALNRLSQVTDWLGQATKYHYDPASNLLGEDYPNGAGVSFTYDAANRLLKVMNTFQGSDGNPISSFTYLLDAVGNRLQVTDGSGDVTSYGYNALNELTSVTAGGTTTFTYDAVGNRLTLNVPGTSTQYSYDAADRLLAAGNTTFEYDKNGNQITKIPPNGKAVNFAYDAANRLVAVTGWKSASSFSYDGDGNRISQTDKSGTYNYLNDVATALPVVLQESGPDGNIGYDYGLGLIAEMSSKFEYFYQYDGLGSVVGLTDPRSKLAGRYAYDAWGETDLSIPDSKIGTDNKFRFTGEALDPGTELYYLRARYYDPLTGRFLQKDRMPGFPLYPLTLNRFAYTLNRPTNISDPSGLAPDGPSSNLTMIANANSTVPISSEAVAPPKQPSSTGTYPCFIQYELPPSLKLFMDAVAIYRVLIGMPSLPGATSVLLVPATCGKA